MAGVHVNPGQTTSSSGGSTGDNSNKCGVQNFMLVHGTIPELLFVQDRSGSMMFDPDDVTLSGNGITPAPSSKWVQMRTAIEQVVAATTTIQWGLEMFPQVGHDNKNQGCDVSTTLDVAIAANSSAAIKTALDAASPGGSTPTGAAINTAVMALTKTGMGIDSDGHAPQVPAAGHRRRAHLLHRRGDDGRSQHRRRDRGHRGGEPRLSRVRGRHRQRLHRRGGADQAGQPRHGAEHDRRRAAVLPGEQHHRPGHRADQDRGTDRVVQLHAADAADQPRPRRDSVRRQHRAARHHPHQRVGLRPDGHVDHLLRQGLRRPAERRRAVGRRPSTTARPFRKSTSQRAPGKSSP